MAPRRVYPITKNCQVCGKPFLCYTRFQAKRNKTCSKECTYALIGKSNSGKAPPEQQPGMILITCAVCGKQVWKHKAWVKRVKTPVCSYQCNGVLRGQDLKVHAHKGRSGWTEESYQSYMEKMTGPNNPAWRGGVMYRKTHGNYAGAKYVRCPKEFLSMSRADGYVMEHRLVMAQMLGRCLERREVVHHIDHNPLNNAPENLMLFKSNQEHKLFEGQA